MCCRLRLDLRELRKKSGGFFGSGESTGSIGVVTLNMVVWLGKTARLSVRLLTKAVCSLWHFFLLVWLMNAFFSETGESLWRWGIFNLTRDGMDQGLLVVVRVAFVIVLGTLYNHIATAQDGINAINWMLTPLSFLFLPVGQISLILGTALQFVPLLRQETARIQKAQKARGASFGKGNFLTKGKNLLPLLLPVFLCAFSHGQASDVNLIALFFHKIRHIEGADHRNTQFQKLCGEKQVPLQVRPVNDVDDPIRPLSDQVVPRHDFFQGVGGK